ncbi:MAG: 50S ribosomal protein L35 [Gammaproteobacteria bacterium]
MPKQKTNKGALKRFKKTAGGYKFRRANRNHILTKKAQKRKKQIRANQVLNQSDSRLVARMLCDD